jgi:hypothetical protein
LTWATYWTDSSELSASPDDMNMFRRWCTYTLRVINVLPISLLCRAYLTKIYIRHASSLTYETSLMATLAFVAGCESFRPAELDKEFIRMYLRRGSMVWGVSIALKCSKHVQYLESSLSAWQHGL